MKRDAPRLVIGGVHSGAGKTSVTLGLVAALARRGSRVQTFKVGPDFLDPTYLARASGRPCYNLDGWMCGEDYARRLFGRAAGEADVSVTEGVMGLFDGASSTSSEGSTAEMARWLEAPVVLVLDAHGVARSFAAMAKGYADFEAGVNVAGVVANRCGSERHAQWLKESLAASGAPPLLGAIPKGAFPQLPSRHLGLVTADSDSLPPNVLDALADAVERHIPLDDLLRLAGTAKALPKMGSQRNLERQPARLGVAFDRAFHFYYQDFFDELEARGCELVRFSPIEDEGLPAGLDAIYFGGGYPEAHAEALAGNHGMLSAFRNFAEQGKPIYGECGGLMYLSQGIETTDGRRHAMAGLLPAWTRMLSRRKMLGYVEVTLKAESLFGLRGDRYRGHAFHYSELTGDPSADGKWQRVYEMERVGTGARDLEGFQRARNLISYVHAHYASRPATLDHFLATIRRPA